MQACRLSHQEAQQVQPTSHFEEGSLMDLWECQPCFNANDFVLELDFLLFLPLRWTAPQGCCCLTIKSLPSTRLDELT